MANKTLFKSLVGKLIGETTAVNEELAPAYAFTPQQALAQYTATGCLNRTFYATAGEQLDTVRSLCAKVPAEFVARTAVYAREQGAMKDMPALLCAVLASRSPELLGRVFERVIDNGKMLRNFVQIIRSGVAGRKSLGTLPRRLVRDWLDAREDEAVFRACVGNDPSLADIVKMVHPKPRTKSREALYGYMIGRQVDTTALPEVVRRFEEFKADPRGEAPDVPFEMLTGLSLGRREWTQIARQGGWQMTRMNLNTFVRHGVFADREMVAFVADRLRDRDAIRKARAFPYQLLMGCQAARKGVPAEIREALQDAMEIAIENVPRVEGRVIVCPDVSGSMGSSVTGHRKGATSAVRCIDVAALVAAAIVRKNPTAQVLPFEHNVVPFRFNPRDSVMTNAQKLGGIGGGGTNCSAPLRRLNGERARGDLVIFISDNQSWVDAGIGRGTATMREWNRFKKLNPSARLVCIDIQPYGTTQACEREDILNVGGFSDRVFEIVKLFADGKLKADHWVGVIEQVEL
ncbi:MAG: RNA-binding protein [Acidobacteriota bacterium]